MDARPARSDAVTEALESEELMGSAGGDLLR